MHEDVDRTDVDTQLLAEAQDGVVVRQIDDVARGLGAMTGGFGRVRQRRRGTAHKTKPRSLRGERESDPLTDTAAGACDHGRSAVKIAHPHPFSSAL